MTISDHAVRRYKQRIGKRTASKRRIVAQINRDLLNDVKYRKKSKVENHYILVTSKYRAVCCKNRVVTITKLSDFSYEVDTKEDVELDKELVEIA